MILYFYLKLGTLTGDDARDRLTLLLADQYILSNEFLYKLATPRTKKQQRVLVDLQRLCIPKKFRHVVLEHHHDKSGHFGTERMFITMSNYCYWKSMYADVRE